jgi:hypothetical protein
VRRRHRDRVDPRRVFHAVLLDELHDSSGEPLPLEVGLEPGQEEKRLAELVFGEIQRQLRRLVLAQVVLIEEHDRASRPVVEKRVGVERHDLAHLEIVEQVLAHLADGAARIGEPGQPRDEVQVARNLAGLDREVVQTAGISHTPILFPGPQPPQENDVAPVKP